MRESEDLPPPRAGEVPRSGDGGDHHEAPGHEALDDKRRKRGTLRARELRRTMSLPEVLLWQRLRRSELHIRRQHPEGRYITDFFCAAARTVIEVDGEFHALQREADARRDERLARRGLETLRVEARPVLADPDAVAEGILSILRDRVGRTS